MSKMVVIEGRECLVTDGVMVVGDAWIRENGVDRLLCGRDLSSFHLYKEIPIRDFLYAVSRVRVQQEGRWARDRRGVYVSIKEVSFGGYVVNGEKEIKELLELYKEYWEEESLMTEVHRGDSSSVVDCQDRFEKWFPQYYSRNIEHDPEKYSLEKFSEYPSQYVQDIAHHDWQVWRSCHLSMLIKQRVGEEQGND